MEQRKRHIAPKHAEDPVDFTGEEVWHDVPALSVDNYLWVKNGYTPSVRVKIFHTERNLYLYYHVSEKSVTIRRTKFGSDVWKDSCVEFFLNPFPDRSDRYFNMEFNALGVMLIGIGRDGDDSKRYYLREDEVQGLVACSTIKKAVTGAHGADHWRLYVRIPKEVFEKQYGMPLTDAHAIANFYKCGDETEWEHYGAWNKVDNATPNFHLPQWFGELTFAP
jgi:hypothetical protein